MPVYEFQTFYYIMFTDATLKAKEQEEEEKRQKAARADAEIKKQLGSADRDRINVMDDKEMERLGIPKTSTPVLDPDDPQNKAPTPPPRPSITTSDLEEFLEEEGLA